MTIFARDADTGMAKWVYQMTPHDEWDYDGVNEMILADIDVNGKMHQGPGPLRPQRLRLHPGSRDRRQLLVAEKYDPAVNWATKVDMETGRPQVVDRYSTGHNGEDFNTTGICPAALGTKDQQPSAYSPQTGLFYVPTNHVCMDYEPFKVSYTAGQPYVGATLSMYPGTGRQQSWQLHRLGCEQGQDRLVRTRSPSRSGRVPWRPAAASSSTERSRAI